MKKDFTLYAYEQLLDALIAKGYRFDTFGDRCADTLHLYSSTPLPPTIVLRHDVDKKPENSLATARIEAERGIRASYYFRVGKESNDPSIIREIVALGHEIGYHYEDVSICKGDIEKAKAHFEQWLAYFRTFYPVKTICMHGAPMSPWDSRTLWKHYDYHDFGIIGEPYFDVDYSKTFYLTDTGRCWDGYKVSVRDKIVGHQDRWIEQGLVYHHTADIIRAIEAGTLPKQVMITTHPQRWTNNLILWVKEGIVQNLKNIIKRYVAKNSK